MKNPTDVQFTWRGHRGRLAHAHHEQTPDITIMEGQYGSSSDRHPIQKVPEERGTGTSKTRSQSPFFLGV